MSKRNIERTNEYYSDIYDRLGLFSISPYNWTLFNNWTLYGGASGSVPLMDMSDVGRILFEYPLKLLLSPILVPATIVTCALALVAAVVVVLAHIVSLIDATSKDDATVNDSPAP